MCRAGQLRGKLPLTAPPRSNSDVPWVTETYLFVKSQNLSLAITESQYRGEGGTRVPSRPSAAGLVSQSATDRDDELRNHDELIAAVPFAWGWGLAWTDINLAGSSIYCAASA
jgi:hypothetical protein